MSLDRAILLPHEFDKREDILSTGDIDAGVTEVLRSPTKNSVEEPQESDEHAQDKAIEKS